MLVLELGRAGGSRDVGHDLCEASVVLSVGRAIVGRTGGDASLFGCVHDDRRCRDGRPVMEAATEWDGGSDERMCALL